MMNRRTLVRAAVGAALAGFGGVARIAAASVTPAEAELAKLLQRLAEEYSATQSGRSHAIRIRRGRQRQPALAARRSFAECVGARSRSGDARTRDLARIDRDKLGCSRAARLRHRGVCVLDVEGSAGALRHRRYQSAAQPLSGQPDEWHLLLAARVPRLAASAGSAQDLDAYFARLTALGRALDQETERIRHDAGHRRDSAEISSSRRPSRRSKRCARRRRRRPR